MVAEPWNTENPSAYIWTQKAFDDQVAGELKVVLNERRGVSWAEVEGRCPRCHHPIPYVVGLTSLVAGGGGGVRGLDTIVGRPGVVRVTLECCCAEAHEGRPKDVVTGCNVQFAVNVVKTETNQ